MVADVGFTDGVHGSDLIIGEGSIQKGDEPSIADSFVEFAISQGALLFGQFFTKAGRNSPYFFNAGNFSDGRGARMLSEYYARRLNEAMKYGLSSVSLFGPAYKGIPLVSTLAVAYDQLYGISFPFTFNRKEPKDHGERGEIVGAPISGRILICDDVISAGTSVRESVDLIREAGAEPAGVLVSFDRMERGEGNLSAVQEVQYLYDIPVFSIATLADLVRYLERIVESGAKIAHYTKSNITEFLNEIRSYRQKYGVD
ncbi:orotate phosphoribosyltransferase [Candidatus Nomurabacteria bacterium]|nr:orotate phosphoribosyltransferase [Candidatus Kaiserbacteria bacterium]MCB9814101.1 orotate phosphoribosyltransferase [Candidatus Nomurabacteria bacterium]